MGEASLKRRAARRTIRLFFFVLFSCAGVIRKLLTHPDGNNSAQPERILLVRLDLLGDVLFSLHAATALREQYPDAFIAVLTLPYTAELARLSPDIDEVIAVDTNRVRSPRQALAMSTWREYFRVVQSLRRRRYDLAVSVYGRMGSLWAFMAGARRSIGYSREAYPYVLSDPLPGGRHHKRMHEIDYVGQLSKAAGAGGEPLHPSITVTADSVSSVNRLLEKNGISKGDRLIVIHAGSINGAAKRWPATNWAHFSDSLKRRMECEVVLIGAGGDKHIAQDVQSASSGGVVSLVGETSVSELVAVIARADLVASGDSGPLHICVALGRPLLAVYGPTDPVIYGPHIPVSPTAVLRHDLPCSPCYTLASTAECPLGDPICMRLVTVSQMVESALNLLMEANSGPMANV